MSGPLSADDPRHGTANGYNNLGCRCQPCRDAWAQWYAERRKRKAQEEPPVHGSPNTYLNWACRCDRCKAAHTVARREQNVRRALAVDATETGTPGPAAGGGDDD